MFHSIFRRCYSFFKPSSPEALRALYDEMRNICNCIYSRAIWSKQIVYIAIQGVPTFSRHTAGGDL